MNIDNKFNIKELKENDIYSLILYAIYKCTGNQQYSTLSELVYTLDRDNLMRLCSVFGGCTLKIPTLDELKVYSAALLVYNLIKEGRTFKAAFTQTGLQRNRYNEVLKAYKTIDELVTNYGR